MWIPILFIILCECVAPTHCRRSILYSTGINRDNASPSAMVIFTAIDVCVDVVHCEEGRRIHHQC